MTESEQLFERFCERRGISCERIPEATRRTPDYEIIAGDTRIKVEVKQIEPNADDRATIGKLERGQSAPQWLDMSRARQSILDAVRQLRPHVKGRQPGLVVLYETHSWLGYLDGDDMARCLYGDEIIRGRVPRHAEEEALLLESGYGGGRVATEGHNTTLSAVAVLRASPEVDGLWIYHNMFAEHPIEPRRFCFPGVRHFAWRPQRGQMAKWVEVTESAA
jgi:hypothetical protein